MQELTELEKALKNQDFITALGDKAINVQKKDKTYCANLFISEGRVYAISGKENNSVVGTAILTNVKRLGREVRPTDRIKITQLLPQSVVIGEIAGR